MEAPSPATVLRRLVRWGLVAADDVVDGEVAMRVAPGRHGALIVESQNGSGAFVKVGVGTAGREEIAREAEALAQIASSASLDRIAPRALFHDPETATLVLELVPSRSPFGLVDDPSPPILHRPVGAWLGRALADLHAAPLNAIRGAARHPGAPWFAWLDEPPLPLAVQLEPSAGEIARLVQGEPGLAGGLVALRAAWRPSCVCHMDLRLDNVVVPPEESGLEPRLADWEGAAWGDPAWDIGWALGSCLSTWVDSMPVAVEAPLEDLVAGAERPLADVRAAAGVIWGAYRDRTTSPPVVSHVARCAAVRLLATAMERIDAVGALTGASILQTQLAASMMARPEAAAHDLLGVV